MKRRRSRHINCRTKRTANLGLICPEMVSSRATERWDLSRALLSRGTMSGGFDVIGDIVLIFILQLEERAFAECAEEFPEAEHGI
jgi:hypothetical protein